VSRPGTLTGLQLRLEQGILQRNIVGAELKNGEWSLIQQAKHDHDSVENEENLSDTTGSLGGAAAAFTGLFGASAIVLRREPRW